jgi:hypothetical protein
MIDFHLPPAPQREIRHGTPGAHCASTSIVLEGGFVVPNILDESFVPFERLYRTLPEEAMYDPGVSPNRPVAFDIGAFVVPAQFTLLLFDLTPNVFRLSGFDVGDALPVEPQRFASQMGFEVQIAGKRPGNLEYQLDPVAIQTGSLAFASQQQSPFTLGQQSRTAQAPAVVRPDAYAPQPLTPAQFNVNAASSFANTAGVGTALQPQRPRRAGALAIPYTLYATGGQFVRIRGVIFRALQSPIAFIEYDIAGLLVPDKWLQAMQRCTAPGEGDYPR